MNRQELISATLAMKKWAVVGAHNDPARYGYRIYRLLRDAGYTVWPIHPRLKEIDGDAVYTGLRQLPEVPEVVDMVVNPETGLRVFEDIAALGIKYVWMQPGTRSDVIREYAAAHGISLIEDCVLVRLNAPH
jgi:predicted CoA-binding protein